MITVYVRQNVCGPVKYVRFCLLYHISGCRNFYRRRNFYQIFENLDFSKCSVQTHFLSYVHRKVLHVDLEPKSFVRKSTKKNGFEKRYSTVSFYCNIEVRNFWHESISTLILNAIYVCAKHATVITRKIDPKRVWVRHFYCLYVSYEFCFLFQPDDYFVWWILVKIETLFYQ